MGGCSLPSCGSAVSLSLWGLRSEIALAAILYLGGGAIWPLLSTADLYSLLYRYDCCCLGLVDILLGCRPEQRLRRTGLSNGGVVPFPKFSLTKFHTPYCADTTLRFMQVTVTIYVAGNEELWILAIFNFGENPST